MSVNSFGLDFHPGDLILTTYRPCRVCEVIEDETGTPYSHIGIVVKVSKTEILVADSLSEVKTWTLDEFVERSSLAVLYRFKSDDVFINKRHFEAQLFTTYENHYKGLLYDTYFSWDNVNENGEELLYCSEFIVKLLNRFLKVPIKTKKMNYTKNYSFWVNYFGKVPIPQGEPGMNPGALSKLDLFKQIKILKN